MPALWRQENEEFKVSLGYNETLSQEKYKFVSLSLCLSLARI
jgi:hypothetical protein